MDSETLYLDLYDAVADYAEYAQSDASARNFLPETIIATLTAVGVSAFVTGFSQTFGDRLSTAVMGRVKNLLHKSTDPDSDSRKSMEATVESLKILREYLPLLKESTPFQQAQEERWVAQELEGKGFPPHVAAIVANDMMGRLRQAAGIDNDGRS